MNSASVSSDFYGVDALLRHLSSEMVSSDGGVDLFFSDPFPCPLFSPTPTDFVAQQIPNNQTHQYAMNHTPSSLDSFSPSLFPLSPPSTYLDNPSLYPVQAQSNGLGDFSVLDGFKVKSEECQMGYDYNCNQNFVPHSYNGSEKVPKHMQRSYRSNSFDEKPGFVFQPHHDTLIASSNFQSQALNSPEDNLFTAQMRRVCSTGDLQNVVSTETSPKKSCFLEEANFKVGRYSAEERKERISKYRAKRNQRNFNKTIKYACRKTLADNQPRVRGRFARNGEAGENPKAPCSTRDEDEDEDEFRSEGLHEEREEDMTVRAEEFWYGYGATQFQYQFYGF